MLVGNILGLILILSIGGMAVLSSVAPHEASTALYGDQTLLWLTVSVVIYLAIIGAGLIVVSDWVNDVLEARPAIKNTELGKRAENLVVFLGVVGALMAVPIISLMVGLGKK